MLVAVGHEVDVSLAELAADMRASTPTNAAQIVVPDKTSELANLEYEKRHLAGKLKQIHKHHLQHVQASRQLLGSSLKQILTDNKNKLASYKNLSKLLDPKAALKRGYAIVSSSGKNIKSIKQVVVGSNIDIDLADGRIKANVEAATK
jgi:exodeoxyribonuclease VII large subunit